ALSSCQPRASPWVAKHETVFRPERAQQTTREGATKRTGNMGTLSFEPLLPSALWLTLAVAGAGLLGWYAWRRPGSVARRRWAGILALMATGHLLVLLVLLNPTWVAPVAPPAGKPLLTLLIDATASMATADSSAGRARYLDAARLPQDFQPEVGDRYDVPA